MKHSFQPMLWQGADFDPRKTPGSCLETFLLVTLQCEGKRIRESPSDSLQSTELPQWLQLKGRDPHGQPHGAPGSLLQMKKLP